jgi:hypothetical protein
MWSVVTFMGRTGMTKSDIQEVFLQCIAKGGRGLPSVRSSNRAEVAYGCDTVAGAVLRAWHRLPKYLDASARPIRLRIEGSDPSLESLVLSQNRRADPKEVIGSMLNAGLVRRIRPRYYLPTKDSATIDSLDPLAVDHIAKTIMRLVETASRNVEKSRHKVQLIERYAHVPNLTKSEANAFAQFSRQQGQACLDAIEDWMETRQLKPTSGRVAANVGINAGVHIFAYLGGPAVARRKAVPRGVAKRSTPAREARA